MAISGIVRVILNEDPVPVISLERRLLWLLLLMQRYPLLGKASVMVGEGYCSESEGMEDGEFEIGWRGGTDLWWWSD